jgi:hypothetical protein
MDKDGGDAYTYDKAASIVLLAFMQRNSEQISTGKVESFSISKLPPSCG